MSSFYDHLPVQPLQDNPAHGTQNQRTRHIRPVSGRGAHTFSSSPQDAAQRPTAKELQEHRFVAASVRAAAQVALQPLIRRTHDHLSALAVRQIPLRVFSIISLPYEARTLDSHAVHT